jgi:hypothetical protein
VSWNTTWRKEFEIGYGRPPHATRFKPGQSGNPRGRPKRSKNGKTLLLEALNETVLVATLILRATKDHKTSLNLLKYIEELGLFAEKHEEGVMRIVLVGPNGSKSADNIEQTRILKLAPFRAGAGLEKKADLPPWTNSRVSNPDSHNETLWNTPTPRPIASPI